MKPPNNIPTQPLSSQHAKLHRDTSQISPFGYHQLIETKKLPGFEIYSTEGMIPDYGPAKSDFYRIGVVTNGTLRMQLGLELFDVTSDTLNFSIPGQIHAKSNASQDVFGYYILFEETFIENLIPHNNLRGQFPFFNHEGHQVFKCNQMEMTEITFLLQKIDRELQEMNTDRTTAIKMYLYLLLLTAKRSYERQDLADDSRVMDTNAHLVSRFYKLVGKSFLSLRQVTDYAKMLHVTPNHLNRVVKSVTNQTASDAISNMLAQEAKVLLKSTTLSAAEIAYQLDFSEPAAFSRFFKKVTGLTPLMYRQQETRIRIAGSDQSSAYLEQ
ncbi:AraC family transcriptional regulator [Chitinophaga sp. S165]|uniref:helix-turn-helix domain-containing protein n=1 Tax=Chitinophaga sp. S165 TaxID=2135462 RepID=UPI000D70B3AA|nr:helix-turn-helix domain-containing protein [Chitinophaga sp. S165]PWV53876.1 AraC family transcriptional regulator [Chitinophaga sp. S165]